MWSGARILNKHFLFIFQCFWIIIWIFFYDCPIINLLFINEIFCFNVHWIFTGKAIKIFTVVITLKWKKNISAASQNHFSREYLKYPSHRKQSKASIKSNKMAKQPARVALTWRYRDLLHSRSPPTLWPWGDSPPLYTSTC